MMMRRTKARRGVILTSEGWKKLQNAQQEREKQENSVKSYTIEILSEITQLDPATISKVLHREVGVDKRTLERFFHAFNLEFSQSDYKKLDLVPNKVEKVLDDKRNHYFGKEAPDVSTFYGRTEEINLLKQWILDDNCRLIALVGIGGIGKTTLSAKVAENLSQYFDYSIWFSLRNAPLPITIITNLVQIFSNGEETDLGQNTTIIINRLIGYLQNQHCLVILDNVDAIFSEACYSGHYLGGYEGYGELFQKLGESLHQSCLLMTSRDKPKEVAAMEGQELPIRSLQITGLDIPEVKEIFKVKGIFEAKDSDLKQLINHYSGNPLYLKVIATTVLDLFEGNLADFLAQNKILFGDISDLLDRQFKRLSKLEKTLLYWLAINREPVNINELKADLLLPKLEYTKKSIQEFTISHQFNLLEILESLHRRSLIEKTRDSDNCQKFFLQPVIMEYVTINLIHTILHEIICQEISLCQSHALLKATAPDYIQDIQQRLILAPIIDHLERTLGSQEAIEEKLMNILDLFRGKSENFTGYIAGNIINLLSSFSTKISNKDLSRLNILQGKLQGMTLKNINFKNSNFTKTTFTDTFGIIFSLAFSENEEFLVTGSIRGEVCVWRWKDNQQIFKRQEHTTIVDSVTFSPDSNKIASSSRDRTVKIWDTIIGKCIFTFKSPNHHTIKNLAFNADGSQLFGYSSQEIISWDLETGHSTILMKSEHRICSLRLSSRSSILVLGCENGQVDVWDIHKKALINRFQMNNGLILSVKITDEEQILACSLDKELDNKVVKIWDLQNQQCLDTLKSQSYHISLIDISNCGNKIATGSGEKMIKVWDINTGLYLQSLEGHLSEINAVTFSHQNKLATASVDRTVKIWDVTTGQCLKTLQGRADFVHSVICSQNHRIIASGSQHTIQFWDLDTHDCISTFFEEKDWLSSLILSPDEKMIACANIGDRQNIIRIWQINNLDRDRIRTITKDQISHQILAGHNDSIWSIAFSPDSTKIASGSSDRTVKIWQTQTGDCLTTLEGHTRPVLSVTFSPDGKTIASCGGHSIIKIWDVETAECKLTLQEKASYIIKFSSNDILASGQTSGIVKLWDTQNGECIETLGKLGKPIVSMTCSHDGQFLAYGCYDGTVNVWDINTHQLIEILPEQFSSAWSLAFSSDSNFLVVGREQEVIQLWEIKTGRMVNFFRGDRPYESINISGVTGLASSRITSLKELGGYT